MKNWQKMLCGLVVTLALTILLSGMIDEATAQVAEPAAGQGVPFKKVEDSASELFARVVGGLAVVVLVGIGAVFLLKRYLPSFYHPAFAGAARIKVVEVRRLTPKAALFLIELDGVRLLLGQSGDRLTTLHDLPKGALSGEMEK